MAEFVLKASRLGFGVLPPVAQSNRSSYTGTLVQGTGNNPSLQCTLRSGAEVYLTVTYANSGPTVRANSIGHAAKLMNLTPWALLALVPSANFRIARSESYADNSWLGYEHPNEARKLARRLASDKILNDSEFLVTVTRNTGERGRPSREVWLSRTGALKLAGKSETPRAYALYNLIMQVFEAVIDGRSPRTDPAVMAAIGELRSLVCTQSEQLAAYAKRTEEQEQRIRSLQTQVANDVGEVSAEWVEQNVRAPLHRIARIEAGCDDTKAVSRARRSIENRVRNIVCFNGRGSAWIHYPRDAQLIRILQRTLATMEQAALDKLSASARERAEAKAKAEVELRMKQLGLFDGIKLAS